MYIKHNTNLFICIFLCSLHRNPMTQGYYSAHFANDDLKFKVVNFLLITYLGRNPVQSESNDLT